MEPERGIDLAGFRGIAVGYHRAGAVLAMSIEQGCNQVAVIVRGKWLAVGSEVGCLAGRNVGGVAVNNRVICQLQNVRNGMTKIAINENGFCVVGLFGKAAHLVSRKVWCGIFPERDVMLTNLIDAIYPVKAMAVQIQKQSGVKQSGISFARIAPLHGVK